MLIDEKIRRSALPLFSEAAAATVIDNNHYNNDDDSRSDNVVNTIMSTVTRNRINFREK